MQKSDDLISKVIIEIDTTGAAWKNGNFEHELNNLFRNKILRDLNDFEHGPHLWPKYNDSNGNVCCHLTIKYEDEENN